MGYVSENWVAKDIRFHPRVKERRKVTKSRLCYNHVLIWFLLTILNRDEISNFTIVSEWE